MKKIIAVLGFTLASICLQGCEVTKAGKFDIRLFSDDIEQVQAAIQEGADIKSRNYGRTALLQTLIEGSEDNKFKLVKLLIDSKVDVDAKDNEGNTALMIAAGDNELEIAKLLIHSGADVNAKNNEGNTALILSIMSGFTCNSQEPARFEVVKLLIDCGANVGAENNDGKTALYFSKDENFEKITKLLIERLKSVPDFIKAASEGDTKNLISLIEQGMNINAQDEDGFTALMRAAQGSIDPEQAKRKLEIIKILLKKGANYKLKDNVMKFTALRWAQESGNERAEDELKAAGAAE